MSIFEPAEASTVAALRESRKRMSAAAKTAGRDPAAPSLIVVTKTFDAAAIRPLAAAGQRQFGENRVQEAQAKWPALRAEFADVELHLIGPLQSNKAREAVELFDAIHTLDRPKIAEAIAGEAARTGKSLKLFVQVNTGEEPQKAGILPKDAATFVRYCRDDLGLALTGLMCIPPVEDEPAVHFAFLAKLAVELGLRGLSMGMSSDFEAAVQFGATHVRIGSAILGAR